MVNVGKNIPYMDAMGYRGCVLLQEFFFGDLRSSPPVTSSARLILRVVDILRVIKGMEMKQVEWFQWVAAGTLNLGNFS